MKDLSQALKYLAGEGDRGDRIKAAISRAAQLANLTYGRAFEIWYGRARRIDSDERNAILAAVVEKEISYGKQELHELRIRQARLESRLNQMEQTLRRAVSERDGETIEQIMGAVAPSR